MKIGIMQPYLFPYIGYFQLIRATDVFIIYDDVNYIKQGWINRNRILLDNKDYLFTLQLKDASSFKKINEIDVGTNKEKLLKTIRQAYIKAPYFTDVMPLVESIMSFSKTNLAEFITNSIKNISLFIGINTQFLLSSTIGKNNDLKGPDKVIYICKILRGDTYINPIGGVNLYDKKEFLDNDISLYFLKTNEIKYDQFKNVFIPNLSIIDIIMFNSVHETGELLTKYELI